jgi:hypothetical protein
LQIRDKSFANRPLPAPLYTVIPIRRRPHQPEALPALGRNFHLVPEPHVMIPPSAATCRCRSRSGRCRSRPPTGRAPGPAQPVDGRPLHIEVVNFPFVLGNLRREPFRPFLAEREPVLARQPAVPPCPQARLRIGLAARRVEVEIGIVNLPRRFPPGVEERDRRLGPSVQFQSIRRSERNEHRLATASRLFRSAPDAVPRPCNDSRWIGPMRIRSLSRWHKS